MSPIKMSAVRFGIAGCGRHAQQKYLFCDRYLKNVQLGSVFDINPLVRENLKIQRPDIRVCESLDEILDDKSISFVVIAAQTASHFALAKSCIESGKNVLIEKPLTATLAEAQELNSILEKHPVKIMLGHHRRFGEAERMIAKCIQNNGLGKVIAIQVTHNFNDRSRSPMTGYLANSGSHDGGVVYEYLSHEIDLLRFYYPGVSIQSIQGFRQNIHHFEDTVSLQFLLDNGVVASYLLSSATTDQEEYKVFGTTGQISFNRYRDPSPRFYSLDDLSNRPLRFIREYMDALKSLLLLKYGFRKYLIKPYIDEICYFVRCIQEDKIPDCSIREGIYVMAVLERVVEALK
ncbi:Gfo/Idh/MocA family oxidoreductase [bacterium]|nr:Gfo/Idh/MocA family oxidoreductase [bacterium]